MHWVTLVPMRFTWPSSSPVFVPKRCGIEGAELWDKIVPEHYAKELAALKAAEKGK